MKLRVLALICAAVLLAQSCAAQPDVNKRILGVWRGELDHLPAFTLVVTDEGGELQGAVLFYLIRRDKPGEPPTATPGIPEPIFHPVFDGKMLRFQVSHRRAHPPRTLNDPPVPFELALTEDGRALLQNMSEGMPLTVTHSDY